MLEILTSITEGKSRQSDVDLLTEMGETIKDSSLCALGQTAPNPVLTTIKFFPDEYNSHINGNCCPAGVCRKLISYKIHPEICKGCGICMKDCPQEAISGERKKPHEIDPELCIRCGICYDTCPFGAIKKA